MISKRGGSGLVSKGGEVGHKILEPTGVGPMLEKRRLWAFLGLPSLSWLQRPPPGHPPPPGPRHCRGLAGAVETWEPPLPTTPTVLESGEQMPLLAKQLMKQTVCFRPLCFEADFVVGVV